MRAQPDLFGDLAPDLAFPGPAARLPARSLAIDAGARLTPAQQRFNKLLARVEALTAQIDAVRTAADAHRPLHSSTMDKLHKEFDGLMRRMVNWLDQRLQRKGLTKALQRYATEIIINLSETLAAQGDLAMRKLHDNYREDDLETRHGAEVEGMKEALEQALGKSLGDGEDGDPLDLEALLRAAMKEMDEQQRAAFDKRQAQQAARRAKKPRSAKHKQAEQESADAQGMLRAIFRQLASALHPDRETDPQQRKRKSALMAEANAAYRRRDLTALLKLQLRVELADPLAIARLADEKIDSLSRLLKDQVATLGHELAVVEQQARDEFGMASYGGVTAETLARSLPQQRQRLQQHINQMHQDLALVQDDDLLKHWLREQHKLAQRAGAMDELEMILGMGAAKSRFRGG
jgi:hypothetical protein